MSCAGRLVTKLLIALLAATPAQAAMADRTQNPGCTPRGDVTIAFVGDLIFQEGLQRTALAPGARYSDFWRSAQPLFAAVDAVYGNVEGAITANVLPGGSAVADPGRTFASDVYAQPAAELNFNYHPSLVDDLKATGFVVVSTANNHALDRSSLGVDRTLDHLEAAGLTAVGTRRRGAAKSWGKTTRIRDLNVGWVACTYGTNGYEDAFDQVLECYTEKDEVLRSISELSARPDVDAVVFVPHWGIENHTVVARRQIALAREAIAAGAAAVIGTHPHVLQEWHWVTAPAGQAVPVIYSTGNFVSDQPHAFQRRGMIVMLTLRKDPRARNAGVVATRYTLTQFLGPARGIAFPDYDAGTDRLVPRAAWLSDEHATRVMRDRCQ